MFDSRRYIRDLIRQRDDARRDGDYLLADWLRADLAEIGVFLEDTGNTTRIVYDINRATWPRTKVE